MNQKILRLIVIGVVVIGIVLAVFVNWIAGGIVAVIGAVLLFVLWRMNVILGISEALAKDDMDEAKRRLAAVRNPQKLNDYSKTYYNFFKGIVDTRDNNFKEAEQSFKTSLEINRFRAPDEKATAHLMIAQLLLRKRNRVGATRHLKEAKDLAKNQQIHEQIKTLVKQQRLKL